MLPGEEGHTKWFRRLNAFEQQETLRQVAWKRKHWPDPPDGEWTKRKGYTCPHILPDANRSLALSSAFGLNRAITPQACPAPRC